MYAVLALLSAAENILPPLPADTGVALGAFLSHRGVTSPIGVFLVVWLANVLGATGVYLASRRYGRRLFATGAGRRLLSPQALRVIEREYVRFGPIGIFICRLLPGVRAVVPPFVGLADLPLLRAMLPIAAASGLWYGTLTALGAALGSQWERITQAIASLNRALAIAAVVLVLGAVVWYLIRRRRAPSGALWIALARALGPEAGAALDVEWEPGETGDSALCAAALLLLELAYADEALTPDDRTRIAADLRARWDLAPAAAAAAQARSPEQPGRLAQYARRVRSLVGQPERAALVERLWTVALSLPESGSAGPRLVALSGDLLGLSPAELAAARSRAAGEIPS